MKQIGFFDESNRLEELSKIGDPLEKLERVMEWHQFSPILNRVFEKERKAAGRPPYSYLLMFKILVLARLFNLSDDQTEYQIKDRMTFMRFLGLTLGDRVPDAKTIWLFRENLVKAGVMKELFEKFNETLVRKGIITRTGTIVDASFANAPRQRNNRDENKEIKEGNVPQGWEKPENANKRRQKDTDARWAKKGTETHFGFKDHAKVDAESKLIVDYSVTDAAVHDSQEIVGLIDENDREIFADSAYVGEELQQKIQKKAPKAKLSIHEKGYRNKGLTEEQKAQNKKKSKTRCRVEHVFGFMTNSMHGITVRSIGMERATFNIGLMNLVYNMCRSEFLQRPMPSRA